MAGNLAAAGADEEPSRYAALGMDRYITGLCTQRSPLRDADVPYIQAKFYGATRFDSILDGLNSELTAKLTLARRAGTTEWNSYDFGAGFGTPYSFKCLLNGAEKIQVFSANASAVDDITTSGTAVNIWSKASGAGKTRYCGVGNTMYFGDGANFQRYFKPNTAWTASTMYTPGQIIYDPVYGNLQLLISTSAGTSHAGIWGSAIAYAGVTAATVAGVTKYFAVYTLEGVAAPAMTPGYLAAAYGQTTYPAMNSWEYVAEDIAAAWGIQLTASQIAFYAPSATGALTPAAETGYLVCATDDPGISGTVLPRFASGAGYSVQDAQCTWVCIGPPTQNVGIAAPAAAPTVTPGPGCQIWQPYFEAGYYSIIDTNGNVQVYPAAAISGVLTGAQQPTWAAGLGNITNDGNIVWFNCGILGSWSASQVTPQYSSITDQAGNLQYATTVGTTGGSYPSFSATPGATTTDGSVTWRCVGPGTLLTSGAITFAYSFGCSDGSVSTASPTFTIGSALGLPGCLDIKLGVTFSADPQCDSIYIGATPVGQATLLTADIIPNNDIGGALGSLNFTYHFVNPDPTALNAFLPLPIADSADPPPAGLSAPVYHLGRLFGFVGNQLRYSNGMNTGTGNGLTQWPPLNFDTAPELIVRLSPCSVNGPALLVHTTSNLYIISGSGTESSPLQPMQLYMPGVGILNYDAMTVVGSTIYAYTNRRKFISLDPSSGYTEIGFFIGDQFLNLTTGGYDQQLFDPAYVSVVWHERNSGDSAIYVCDGSATGGVGWFRYSPVAAPESGFVWSPFAAITGGISGVASVEVSPGQFEMIVMPGTSGPALKRDTTVNSDNGTPFAAYTTLGVIVLCTTGEIAEVAWLTIQSMPYGTKPTVGVLFDELAPSAAVPFDMLEVTSYDPPDLESIGSQTMYSDRYVTLQNGNCPKCTNMQFMIQWAVEDEPNEVLTHNIYGARYGERRQQ